MALDDRHGRVYQIFNDASKEILDRQRGSRANDLVLREEYTF